MMEAGYLHPMLKVQLITQSTNKLQQGIDSLQLSGNGLLQLSPCDHCPTKLAKSFKRFADAGLRDGHWRGLFWLNMVLGCQVPSKSDALTQSCSSPPRTFQVHRIEHV